MFVPFILPSGMAFMCSGW